MAARRFALAILAWSALGGADQPESPRSSATAQATARIRQPVIVRGGRTLQDGQPQVLRTRERKCAAADMPADGECRIIVTDIE